MPLAAHAVDMVLIAWAYKALTTLMVQPMNDHNETDRIDHLRPRHALASSVDAVCFAAGATPGA